MAAAKGLHVDGGSVNSNAQIIDTSSRTVDDISATTFADFGNFSLGNETNNAIPPVPPPQEQSFNGFDAFGDNNNFGSQTTTNFQSFDAFASTSSSDLFPTPTFSSSSVEAFPAFTSSTVNNQFVPTPAEAGFDMFKDEMQPATFSPSLFGGFPSDIPTESAISTTTSQRGSFTLPVASTTSSPRGSFTSTTNAPITTTDMFQDEVHPSVTSALPSLFGTAFSNDDAMQVLPIMSSASTPRGSFTSTTSLTPTRGSHEIDLLSDYNTVSVSTAASIDFLNDEPKQSRQSSAAAAVLSLFDNVNENAVLRPSNLSGTSPPPNPFKDVQIKRDLQYKMNKPVDPFAELSFIQKR